MGSLAHRDRDGVISLSPLREASGFCCSSTTDTGRVAIPKRLAFLCIYIAWISHHAHSEDGIALPIALLSEAIDISHMYRAPPVRSLISLSGSP